MLGFVLADHDRGIAALQALRRRAKRNAARAIKHVGPCMAAPHTFALDALRQQLRMFPGVGEQLLRQGHDDFRGGVGRAHAAAPR